MNARCTVTLLSALASITLGANESRAQRFEGIITMKLSGGLAVGGANGGRGAPGRSGERPVGPGRGATRGGEARGGEARGGDARGGASRGAESRGGGAMNAPNDPRAEAMRGAMAGGIQQIEYMTRRGKVRIALGGGAGAAAPAAMIYAPEDGVVYTIFPAMSLYAEMAIKDMPGATRVDTMPVPTGRAAPRPPVITHTKQFELIAGHRCEHITITSGAQKTDVCMGKGLGVFIMPAGGGTQAWNQVMTEANGFPLKVTGPDGRVIMEVVKIERKALGAALFDVPDSYTKMPEMGRRPPG